ncbi:MAG: hydrogenase iron-sulfur subunit [Anaerolineaceae bacterium]|jgi:F420-non-reducing hydrogenase iron-sulfur subunit
MIENPRIVLFQCKWCLYAKSDQDWVENELPGNIKLIKVPCTGRVNSLYLLNAVQGGADGIMISGCLPENCHYKSGNLGVRRQLDTFANLLEYVGFERERVRMFWIDLQDRGGIQREIAAFSAAISQMEPNPRLATRLAEVEGGENA